MKPEFFVIAGLSLLACVFDAPGQPVSSTNAMPDYNKLFKDEREKISYAIGMNFGSAIRSKEFDVDLDVALKAMKDSLAGNKMLITDTEQSEILSKDLRKYLSDKNKKTSDAFMAKNKTQAGVITLPSGLQYNVLVEGKGESPKPSDIATVNYRGALLNGFEFDTSYGKNGKPADFELSGGKSIKGWTEALLLMKPGAKWQIFVPYDLAYGEMGRGPIGPNEVLVFEAEFISSKAPKPPEPLTSDIVRVPSAEEMKNGTQPKTLTPAEVEQEKARAAAAKKTNN